MKQSTTQNRSRRQSAARSSLLKLCLTGTALAWGLTASAQTFTTTTNFTVGTMVPDGDASGLTSVQTISTPITTVTDLKVTLKVSGTWTGDLYCYLAHGDRNSVLLNRLGRIDANDLGYNDVGLDLTFDDAATNSDLHVYRLQLSGNQGTPIPGTLTSAWAPDARVTSPANVLDTDARSAFLGSFNGVDPNGEWVLFIADMEAGDIHVLDSWGLEITGDTAPTVPASTIPQQSLTQAAAGSAAKTTLVATAKDQVSSAVKAPTTAAPALLTGLTAGAGGVKLTFTGRASYSYQIQRASALKISGTAWTNIGSATTDAAGRGAFTDTNPPTAQGYYRTVSQ